VSKNKEVPFLKALIELLQGHAVQYSDGRTEPFVSVSLGKLTPGYGYPRVAVVPLGPQFITEVLGGQRLSRKGRYVGVTIEIHYEHHDEEQGVLDMSDILWGVVDAILDNPRLGGAESIQLGEIDYAYAIKDEKLEDGTPANEIPDWGYKGVALLPVYAEYRYT